MKKRLRLPTLRFMVAALLAGVALLSDGTPGAKTLAQGSGDEPSVILPGVSINSGTGKVTDRSGYSVMDSAGCGCSGTVQEAHDFCSCATSQCHKFISQQYEAAVARYNAHPPVAPPETMEAIQSCGGSDGAYLYCVKSKLSAFASAHQNEAKAFAETQCPDAVCKDVAVKKARANANRIMSGFYSSAGALSNVNGMLSKCVRSQLPKIKLKGKIARGNIRATAPLHFIVQSQRKPAEKKKPTPSPACLLTDEQAQAFKEKTGKEKPVCDPKFLCTRSESIHSKYPDIRMCSASEPVCSSVESVAKENGIPICKPHDPAKSYCSNSPEAIAHGAEKCQAARGGPVDPGEVTNDNACAESQAAAESFNKKHGKAVPVCTAEDLKERACLPDPGKSGIRMCEGKVGRQTCAKNHKEQKDLRKKGKDLPICTGRICASDTEQQARARDVGDYVPLCGKGNPIPPVLEEEVDRCTKEIAAQKAKIGQSATSGCPPSSSPVSPSVEEEIGHIQTALYNQAFDNETLLALDTATFMARNQAKAYVETLSRQKGMTAEIFNAKTSELLSACPVATVQGQDYYGVSQAVRKVIEAARGQFKSAPAYAPGTDASALPKAQREEFSSSNSGYSTRAIAAAKKAYDIDQAINRLMKDFSVDKSTVGEFWPGFLPCQSVVEFIDAGIQSSRDSGAVCGNAKKTAQMNAKAEFELEQKSQKDSSLSHLSDADQVLIAGVATREKEEWDDVEHRVVRRREPILDAGTISASDSFALRCEKKALAVRAMISQKLQILAEFPELLNDTLATGKRSRAKDYWDVCLHEGSENIPICNDPPPEVATKEKPKPLYTHLGAIEGKSSSTLGLQELMLNEQLQSDSIGEQTQSIRGALGKVCSDPEEYGVEGFSNDTVFNQLHACDERIDPNLPVAWQSVEQERAAECLARKRNGINACFERTRITHTPAGKLKQDGAAAFSGAMQVLDLVGCVTAFTGIGSAAAQTAKVAVAEGTTQALGILGRGVANGLAQVTSKGALVTGGVMAGGSGALVYSAYDDAEYARGLALAGLMDPEEANQAYQAAREAKESFVRDTVLGMLLGGVTDDLGKGVRAARVGKVKTVRIKSPDLDGLLATTKLDLDPIQLRAARDNFESALRGRLADAVGDAAMKKHLDSLSYDDLAKLYAKGQVKVPVAPSAAAAAIGQHASALQDLEDAIRLGYGGDLPPGARPEIISGKLYNLDEGLAALQREGGSTGRKAAKLRAQVRARLKKTLQAMYGKKTKIPENFEDQIALYERGLNSRLVAEGLERGLSFAQITALVPNFESIDPEVRAKLEAIRPAPTRLAGTPHAPRGPPNDGAAARRVDTALKQRVPSGEFVTSSNGAKKQVRIARTNRPGSLGTIDYELHGGEIRIRQVRVARSGAGFESLLFRRMAAEHPEVKSIQGILDPSSKKTYEAAIKAGKPRFQAYMSTAAYRERARAGFPFVDLTRSGKGKSMHTERIKLPLSGELAAKYKDQIEFIRKSLIAERDYPADRMAALTQNEVMSVFYGDLDALTPSPAATQVAEVNVRREPAGVWDRMEGSTPPKDPLHVVPNEFVFSATSERVAILPNATKHVVEGIEKEKGGASVTSGNRTPDPHRAPHRNLPSLASRRIIAQYEIASLEGAVQGALDSTSFENFGQLIDEFTASGKKLVPAGKNANGPRLFGTFTDEHGVLWELGLSWGGPNATPKYSVYHARKVDQPRTPVLLLGTSRKPVKLQGPSRADSARYKHAEAAIQMSPNRPQGVRQLAADVLADRRKRGESAPVGFNDPPKPVGDAWWSGRQPASRYKKSQVQIVRVHGEGKNAAKPTEVLVHEGGVSHRYIVREISAPDSAAGQPSSATYADVARKSHAASRLNQLLGLHTTPASRISEIDGRKVLLVEFTPGMKGQRLRGNKQAWIKSKAVSERSIADTELFEFLVGNGDVHLNNFMVDTRTRSIQVFDYDHAFQPGLGAGGQPGLTFGVDLPTQIHPETLDNLKKQLGAETLDSMRAKFPELSDAEIEGVLFRRDMIFEHAKRLGDDRLLAQSGVPGAAKTQPIPEPPPQATAPLPQATAPLPEGTVALPPASSTAPLPPAAVNTQPLPPGKTTPVPRGPASKGAVAEPPIGTQGPLGRYEGDENLVPQMPAFHKNRGDIKSEFPKVMGSAARDAAGKIQRNQYEGFSGVLEDIAAARRSLHPGTQAGVLREFSGKAAKEIAVTPIRGPYQDYRARALKVIQERGNMRPGGIGDYSPEATIPGTKERVKLTSIGWLGEDSPFTQWHHMAAGDSQKVMKYVETLYERTRNGSLSQNELIDTVAEMHWWMAHAMPYKRGSAAITDAATKAILYSNGIAPGRWRQGIMPDLEAFHMTREEFVKSYRSFFEGAEPHVAQSGPAIGIQPSLLSGGEATPAEGTTVWPPPPSRGQSPSARVPASDTIPAAPPAMRDAAAGKKRSVPVVSCCASVAIQDPPRADLKFNPSLDPYYTKQAPPRRVVPGVYRFNSEGNLSSVAGLIPEHYEIPEPAYADRLSAELPVGMSREANITFAGEGSLSRAYFVHPAMPPEVRALPESARTQWASANATEVIKLRHRIPFPDSKNAYAPADGARFMRADLAMYEVAGALASKAEFGGKPMVRTAKILSDAAEHARGKIRQEVVRGPPAKDLQAAVNCLQNASRCYGITQVQARSTLSSSGFVNSKGKVGGAQIAEADARLAALEQFYRDSHNPAVSFRAKNDVLGTANSTRSGKVLAVGLDYNHGVNAIWDGSSRQFVMVDW